MSISKRNSIAGIALILTVVLSIFSIQAFAKENVENSGYGVYKYPITKESDEWQNFSTKAERLEACQIPEDILSDISTSDLVDTVLNYPLLGTSFFCFDSEEAAYKGLYEDFNGLRELLLRNDATEAILDKYKNMETFDDEEIENISSETFLKPYLTEFLLICDKLHNNFSTEEEAKVMEIIRKKSEERSKISAYSEQSNVYLNYIEPMSVSGEVEYVSEDEDDFEIIEEDEIEEDISSPKTFAGENWSEVKGIKTPRKTVVSRVYKRTPDYSYTEKKIMNEAVKKDYPKAKRLGSATINYNCHSYAWYKQSTANKYWFDSLPTEYISDGSYTLISGEPKINDKVYYDSEDAVRTHSGVVAKFVKRKGNKTIYIKSKWGKYGLYLHEINDTPYSGEIKYYKKAKKK